MKNKSYELDDIFTSVLKQLLPVCIDNTSNYQPITYFRSFLYATENSSSRTLIKKIGLELIHKNYHPVLKPVLNI